MTEHVFAAMDPESVFWFFVVIIAIIAQIAKAIRKSSSGGSGQGEPVSPQEELQRFLENLGAGRKPENQPPAPLPRQAPTRQQAGLRPAATPSAARVRRTPGPVPVRAQPVRISARNAVPVPAKTRRRQGSVNMTRNARSAGKSRRSALLGSLHDMPGIRRAVVLREILGPPAALKRTGMETA